MYASYNIRILPVRYRHDLHGSGIRLSYLSRCLYCGKFKAEACPSGAYPTNLNLSKYYETEIGLLGEVNEFDI